MLLLAGCVFITSDDECSRASNSGAPTPAHCVWWDSGWWDSGQSSQHDTADALWTDTGDFAPGQVCLDWQLDLVDGALSTQNGASQSYLNVTIAPDGFTPSGGPPGVAESCIVVRYIDAITPAASDATAAWSLAFSGSPIAFGQCDAYPGDPLAALSGPWTVAVAPADDALRKEAGEDAEGLFRGLSGTGWSDLAADSAGRIQDISLGGAPIELPDDGSLPSGRYRTSARSCHRWPEAN